MSSEVEETLKRIQSHRGVKGVLIVSADGVPIRSNLDDDETQTYAALLSQLATKARNVVRVLDDQDELAFFRIRSNKHEIMVAPDPEPTASIFLTTSMPLVTDPKTTCLPSSQSVLTVQRKNLRVIVPSTLPLYAL